MIWQDGICVPLAAPSPLIVKHHQPVHWRGASGARALATPTGHRAWTGSTRRRDRCRAPLPAGLAPDWLRAGIASDEAGARCAAQRMLPSRPESSASPTVVADGEPLWASRRWSRRT